MKRNRIINILCLLALSLPVSIGFSKPMTGNTYAVAVRGSQAYMGVGRALAVFDISNAGEPISVGRFDSLDDAIQDIQIKDNLAFIGAGLAGLYIIDISNSSNPVVINHSKTPGFINGVFISDNHVFLAAGAAGMLVMDIGQTNSPRPVSVSTTSGWDRNVVVSEGIAYVASDEEGVRIVDVSNIKKPRTVGVITTPNEANDVLVEDNMLFIACGSAGLLIVDIQDPPDTKLIARENTGYARRLFLNSGYAYVATERNGILALDITQPSDPKPIHRFHAHGSANNLIASDNHIFVADGSGGLLTITLDKAKNKELHRSFSQPPKTSRRP